MRKFARVLGMSLAMTMAAGCISLPPGPGNWDGASWQQVVKSLGPPNEAERLPNGNWEYHYHHPSGNTPTSPNMVTTGSVETDTGEVKVVPGIIEFVAPADFPEFSRARFEVAPDGKVVDWEEE